MTRSFVRRAVIASGLLTASCSLFVSTDDLSGGSNDGGIVDASADADASAASDASPIDAGADAFSCAALSPAPTFCDDFERDTLVGDWTDTILLGGGTVTIDSTKSSSGTRSLLAMTPASGADGELGATIHHATFPGPVSDVQFAFDENIASVVDMNQFDLFRLTLHTPSDPASGAIQIAITFTSTTVYLDENDYRVVPTIYIPHNYTRAPAYGKFQRFAMHLTLGTGAHVTVMLDNDTVVDDDLTSPNVGPASLELVLGMYNSQVPGAARFVNFDDLVLDAK